MDDENGFEEVSIVSNTELPFEKESPFQVRRTLRQLQLLQGHNEDSEAVSEDQYWGLEPEAKEPSKRMDDPECQSSEDGSWKLSSVSKSASRDHQDSQSQAEAGSDYGSEQESSNSSYSGFGLKKETAGILAFVSLPEAHPDNILAEIRLTRNEMQAIADYQTWVANEPKLLEMRGEKPVQLQRVAADKPSFIAAEKGVLLTNGRESKWLQGGSGPVVLWGKHYFMMKNGTVGIYDLNFEEVLEVNITVLSLVTSDKHLGFHQLGLCCGESVRFINRTFESLLSKDPSENTDPKRGLVKFAPEVFIEKTPQEAQRNGDACWNSRVHRISICPYTDQPVVILAFKFDDDDSVRTYIQRGKEATEFDCPRFRREATEYWGAYTSNLAFEHLRSSYSGKWYVVSYSDEEAQLFEKCLFLFDQKTLKLKETYGFSIYPGDFSTLHFLKPQKQVFPFLVAATSVFFLYCEFKDRVYPICDLERKGLGDKPKELFTTHLSDRVWICLETFTKVHLLVVDTDKLCKLLQLN